MNKGKMILGIVLAAMVMAVPFRSKEARITAARAIAGEGMLRLVENSMEHPKVALTFDDGPSAKYTPILLEGLKERGVHATFFIMGKNIDGNEGLIRQMQEEGHLIGNHTYNHVQLNKIPRELACEEIQKTNNEIYEVTGVYPSYIRPPFGAWQENLELCVTMLPVFWDVDTLDWKSKNVNSILKIVKNKVKDGSIILMHDEYQTSVDAALKTVDMLLEQGYEFVTVDQMIVT
ncbi:MAG: polysaccharide deacetylase family protein [Blautia sp.]|nr:polysaccharide deacetylase family protein [Blautia sp.]MDY3998116.1 polysaccharide deacetylase family protein [Blautia sp.]